MSRSLNSPIFMSALVLCALMFVIQHAQAQIVVRENSLTPLSLDEVGTLTSRNGGLGADLWINTPHSYVEKFISFMPVNVQSPVLKDLQQRLLQTAAVPPRDNAEKKADLFMLRLRQLARLGAYEQTFEMVERVPTELRTEEMLQVIISARLIAAEIKPACSAIKASVSKYEQIMWRKWMALCQANDGNKAASSLTLKLLSESGFEVDAEFKQLMNDLAAGGDKKDKALQQWADNARDVVLRKSDVVVEVPAQRFLDSDILFNATLATWWGATETEKPVDKANALLKIYTILEGLGDKMAATDWIDISLYMLENKADKEASFTLSSAIDALTNLERKGDALALILLIAGEQKATSLPPVLLHSILHSLTHFGLRDEARALAVEALE